MTVAAMVSACWKTSVSFIILLLSIIRISLLLLAVDVVFDEDIVDVNGAIDAEYGVATVQHL